jgi:prepilin-type N-terminal cleavage/methylation domain-containing protein
MHRTNRGFTLVELLVVITIIGMLIALLIPAANAVREQARQTTCLNNQRELGQAILGYEQAKRQLPGVLNQIPIPSTSTFIPYTWCEAIFPNLDRNDLWDKLRTNQASTITGLRIGVFMCPDDPISAAPSAATYNGLLSYGVNDQFFVDDRPLANSPATPPVDRNNIKVGQAVVSNLKTRPNFPNTNFPRGQTVTTSQTVMLGDRTVVDTSSTSSTRAGKWSDILWTSLAFPWSPTQTPISTAIMCSSHSPPTANGPGAVVVVTYFDGHGQKVPSETLYPLEP